MHVKNVSRWTPSANPHRLREGDLLITLTALFTFALYASLASIGDRVNLSFFIIVSFFVVYFAYWASVASLATLVRCFHQFLLRYCTQ